MGNAYASKLEQLVHSLSLKNEQPIVSVQLSPSDGFKNTVLDALKSGQGIQLNYRVSIEENTWLWPKTFAKIRFERVLTYDHRADEFLVAENGITQHFSEQSDFVRYLFSLEGLSLEMRTSLTGEEKVEVAVAVWSEPVTESKSVLGWLAFAKFWENTKIKQKELYDVR